MREEETCMATKKDTKQEISDEFVAMVKKTSLSQVRIADLIANLEINRNTFYYHFTSKYDVALWKLRSDLARELRNILPESRLISTPLKEDSKEILPYYVHVETGARMLDCSPFLKALSQCVLSDVAFYRKLFNKREIEFLTQVELLWEPMFYNDISFVLDKRYMPETTQRMLAKTSINCVLTFIIYLLENPNKAEILLNDELNPFLNFVLESLHFAIQKHPINKRTPPPPLR